MSVPFHNPGPEVVTTEVRGVAYEVPAGATIELPAELAYVVAGRGLRLLPGPGPGPVVEGRRVVPPRVPALPGIVVGRAAARAGEDPDASDEPAGEDASEGEDTPEVAQVAAAAKALGAKLPTNRRPRD